MEQERLLKEEGYFKKLLFLSRQKSKKLICKDINDLLPIIKEEEELVKKVMASKDIMAIREEGKRKLDSIVLELKEVNQRNKELVVRSLFFLEDCFKFFASFEDNKTYGNKRQDRSILFDRVT